MLVFWTMERSLPSGRRPGPAGRPQRTRGRRSRERRSAASAGSSHLALPAAALFLRPSLRPLSPPPPPPPPPLKAQHLPPPLRPPRPRPSQPLRGLRTGEARAAGREARPSRLRSGARAGLGRARGGGGPLCAGARVGVGTRLRVGGPGVAVYQGMMPSANGGGTRLGVAGTAPPSPFRPKPLFLSWALHPKPGPPELLGPGDPALTACSPM